jgi:predicted RNase H-like HicB family nuclease
MKRLVIETARTENGYSGACSILKGWIVAHSGSFDEFKKEVEDSIDFYVDCAKEDGEEYPSILDEEYTIEYKFDVRSLLLYYQGIFSFSALETITGINQKQLAHYAAGRSKPREAQTKKIAKGLQNLANELMIITV